jgi:hypothetical protein
MIVSAETHAGNMPSNAAKVNNEEGFIIFAVCPLMAKHYIYSDQDKPSEKASPEYYPIRVFAEFLPHKNLQV